MNGDHCALMKVCTPLGAYELKFTSATILWIQVMGMQPRQQEVATLLENTSHHLLNNLDLFKPV